MAEPPENVQLEFVPPRLICLKMIGDFDGEQVHQIFDVIDVHVRDQPFWLFEVDISALGKAGPAARRAGAERIGRTPEYSLALYGGGLAQRALATLFLKIAELFSGGRRDVASTFAKDQQAAREWLRDEGERRRRSRRAP